MTGFALTNRELALIVALLFWSAAVVTSSRRPGSGGGPAGSVRGLLSATSNKAILVPAVAYLCWITTALAAADAVGLWDARLAKAAVLWLLFSGLGLFGAGLEAAKREGAITGAFKRLLGAAVIFEIVANTASFPLFIEVPAQILAAPCGVAAALVPVRQEHRRSTAALGSSPPATWRSLAWQPSDGESRDLWRTGRPPTRTCCGASS